MLISIPEGDGPESPYSTKDQYSPTHFTPIKLDTSLAEVDPHDNTTSAATSTSTSTSTSIATSTDPRSHTTTANAGPSGDFGTFTSAVLTAAMPLGLRGPAGEYRTVTTALVYGYEASSSRRSNYPMRVGRFPLNSLGHAPRLVQVACGGTHTVFLSASGAVYVTGGNRYGQLGLGGTAPVGHPTLLRLPTSTTSSAASSASSAASSSTTTPSDPKSKRQAGGRAGPMKKKPVVGPVHHPICIAIACGIDHTAIIARGVEPNPFDTHDTHDTHSTHGSHGSHGSGVCTSTEGNGNGEHGGSSSGGGGGGYGVLFTMGMGAYGRLGHGHERGTTRPVKVCRVILEELH